MTADRPT
ncbi:hypothetical protein S40285_09669 [Stachybotrys chlorohalonatus IBT 40285]|nr:hypothetical protein S40285_09669 [Stachybotrys chlorohalonata IBT 40285]